MQETLNWHYNGNPDMVAYYAESDLAPEEVRLMSLNPAGKGECQVDIRADGVSILSEYIGISGENTLQEIGASFTGGITKGQVVTCHVVDTGGISRLSIQLLTSTEEQ